MGEPTELPEPTEESEPPVQGRQEIEVIDAEYSYFRIPMTGLPGREWPNQCMLVTGDQVEAGDTEDIIGIPRALLEQKAIRALVPDTDNVADAGPEGEANDKAAPQKYYQKIVGYRADPGTWHQRLGHPSHATLKNLLKAGVFDNEALLFPRDGSLTADSPNPPCIVCPTAWLNHQPFPNLPPGYERYKPLDKVYSDFMVLSQEGLDGEQYALTFIDASTRYIWAVNTDYRSLAFECFIAWMKRAERQSGLKLKAWQTDGALEFFSDEFKELFKQKGIEHVVSLPYAHQQQGVAERTNRSIATRMRAQMKQSAIPTKYWSFAMNHAVRLHNLLSSRSLENNNSPYRAWTGKKADTRLLWVFGCMVQYRLHTARTGKFGDRARWGIHLGIEKEFKARIVLDYATHEVTKSRDCIFYEKLTLPLFKEHQEADKLPERLFKGHHSFATSHDEADLAEDADAPDVTPMDCAPSIPLTSQFGTPIFIPLHQPDPDDITREAHDYNSEARRLPDAEFPQPNTSQDTLRLGNDSDDDVVEVTSFHDYDRLHYEKSDETGLRVLGLAVAVRHTSPKEPTTVRQALSGPDSEKWRAAMAAEIASLKKRGTWKLVPRSSAKGRKILSGKLVFRIKTLADGSVDKYKARWVVRGFEQMHLVDFTLTYAPVGCHTSVRIVLCIATIKQRPL
ncbi:unnamed protein product [Closterium sp. NIES-53]